MDRKMTDNIRLRRSNGGARSRKEKRRLSSVATGLLCVAGMKHRRIDDSGPVLVWHEARQFSNPGQDAVFGGSGLQAVFGCGRQMKAQARDCCKSAALMG